MNLTKEELLQLDEVREIAQKYALSKFSGYERDDWNHFVNSQLPKKEYEILSFSATKHNNIHNEGEIICCSPTPPTCYPNKHWNIHSVKRLSDGEVFTIGDKINSIERITEFRVEGNQWKSGMSFRSSGSSGYTDIAYLRKYKKQPLFTTEDGVEIFENDYVAIVNLGNWIITDHIADSGWDKEYNPNYGNTYKRFSTKEAVEEYILMNKPCLSINDVIESRSSNTYNSPVNTIRRVRLLKLREKVEQKLKNG